MQETTLLLYENAYNTEDIVRSLNGYQHADEWEGGAWLTTAAGKQAVLFAGTKGTMYRIRSAWKNAPYEAAYVATPWVFKSKQIRPDSQVGNLNWNPKSYMGEWKWVTGASIIDPSCETPDPFGDKGRHFAQFMHAPEPVFTTFGAFIVFKRCISSFTTVTCT